MFYKSNQSHSDQSDRSAGGHSNSDSSHPVQGIRASVDSLNRDSGVAHVASERPGNGRCMKDLQQQNLNSSRKQKAWTSLVGLGARAVSYAGLCLLANKSATYAVPGVQAVNADKVSFQVFEIDSPLLDILWCGQSNDVILVQSEAGTVYRSRDRGDSWKKLHSIMHQTGMSVLDDGQTVSSFLTVNFLQFRILARSRR